jgi:DNA-directed RNA polymerase specialized sigma24 family protein
MPVPPETFLRARKYQRKALEDLFEAVYPTSMRIARGLCGREDVAEGVVRFVMSRAFAVLPRWRDETAAERWFLHHTVLTARRAADHQPAARNDLLAVGGDARYAAFVRAVRALPQQQREAVVLHFGEHLNARYLGVAMDCSTDAAQAHLEAGEKSLRTIAAGEFDHLVSILATVYARHAPAPQAVTPAVRKSVGKGLRPVRLRRLIRWTVLLLLIAAAAAWAVWRRKQGMPIFPL